MKAIVNVAFGQVEIEGDTLKAIAANLGMVMELWSPQACGHCKESGQIVPFYRNPSGFEFFGLECKNCGWRLPFGQNKEGGGMFTKEWEAPYQGGSSSGGSPRQPADAGLSDPSIPF